eukprot:Nk52_evm15s369 gene=Nk52_evmTU15s369
MEDHENQAVKGSPTSPLLRIAQVLLVISALVAIAGSGYLIYIAVLSSNVQENSSIGDITKFTDYSGYANHFTGLATSALSIVKHGIAIANSPGADLTKSALYNQLNSWSKVIGLYDSTEELLEEYSAAKYPSPKSVSSSS